MIHRVLHLQLAGTIVALGTGLAILPMGGCGSSESGKSSDTTMTGGSAGVAGMNGGGTGAIGMGGSGGSSPTAGAGGTSPAPTQDPTTNQWMCTDATGGHVCACNDGIDNDNDQTIDALDPNCSAGPYTDSEAGTAAGNNCGTTQCANCIDDDGDGTIDGADTECTGALDNSEASFATGISGDNSDACKQDCFFDGNSGSGNDGCLWNLKCDPADPGAHAEKPCPYEASYNNCGGQTQGCIDYCRQYTPNGCDCFGCCTVFVDGAPHDVKLLPTCSAGVIDDPNLCPSCTKETTCNNLCDPCEYCLGRPPEASCTPAVPDGGTQPGSDAAPPPVTGQCPTGVVPCTPGDSSACPDTFYCLTGCCAPQVQ